MAAVLGAEEDAELAATDSGNLAEDMLRQGRYALLLRPQVIEHLSAAERRKTLERLFEQMALVPQGQVAIEETLFDDPERVNQESARYESVDPDRVRAALAASIRADNRVTLTYLPAEGGS